MRKRGQITLFLILGVMVIVIVGFVSYMQANIAKKEASAAVKKTSNVAIEAAFIKEYGEGCLKDVSDRGLWLIGEHGGYINVTGDDDYGEPGLDASLYTTYNTKEVPYYLKYIDLVAQFHYPLLEDIEKRLAKYIIIEFERCFDLTTFREEGFFVKGPDINYADPEIDFNFSKVEVDVNVKINEDDVTVKMEYPLNVTKRGFETKLRDFRVELPVRLGRAYNALVNDDPMEGPIGLLNYIKNEWGDGDTDDYNLTDFNCDLHDSIIPGQINIYSRNNEDTDTKIIRLVDYWPYYNKYLKAYVFQFAIKKYPIDFTGEMCKGTP